MEEIPSDNELKASMRSLSKSINSLVGLLKDAGDSIKQEEDHDSEILKKLDVLIRHNEEMAKGILLLLELSREHLPKISKRASEPRPLARPQPRPRPQMQPYIQQRSPPPQQPVQQQYQQPPAPQPLDSPIDWAHMAPERPNKRQLPPDFDNP